MSNRQDRGGIALVVLDLSGVTIARDCCRASLVETRHALFILEHSVGARILESRYLRFASRGD